MVLKPLICRSLDSMAGKYWCRRRHIYKSDHKHEKRTLQKIGLPDQKLGKALKRGLSSSDQGFLGR